MLEVMPQLHSDSSIAAASLLLHILSGSAAPAQLLQSAVATLHQLPLTPESGSQPSLPQIQLACELLQLFTPEAFQALPPPKGNSKAAKGAGSLATEGFRVLLQLVRVGVDGHLVESQELVKLRESAFRRLDADVYAVMPVQQQMQAFLVSCGGVLLPITDRVTCLKKGLSAYTCWSCKMCTGQVFLSSCSSKMKRPLVKDHPVLVSLHFCCCVKGCATDDCKSIFFLCN